MSAAAARTATLLAILLTASAPAARAQTVPAQAAPAETVWTHGTTLSLFGGAGLDADQTAVAAGAGFAWEVTRRLSIEVNGTWLDRGPEASAYAADVSALVSLVSPRRVAPFVRFGGGAYHASYDVTESPIPAFYRRRLEAEEPRLGQRASFDDPAFLLGGGVSAWLGTHTSLRPEVELRAAVRGGRAHWLTTVALRLAYHFEEHPRTSRR